MDQSPLVQRGTEAAGAAWFSCSAWLRLPEQLVAVAAGAARDRAAGAAWFRCNARSWVPGELGSAAAGVVSPVQVDEIIYVI